jgi:hypothetical protein
VWKHLAHPNIAPLLGVTIDPLQLISDWVSGGDLTGYITNYLYADRLGLVGVPFCCIVQHAYPLASYLMSLKALTTSTPAT